MVRDQDKMETRLVENTFDEIIISDCDEFEHCDTHAEVIESMVTQIYSGISIVTGRTLSSSSDLLIVPLLVMSAINVGIILTFMVFIICKAARSTPSRRHLFLSQALLLGLLLGSSLGFAFALEPSGAACAVIRLGTGVAYGLIFSPASQASIPHIPQHWSIPSCCLPSFVIQLLSSRTDRDWSGVAGLGSSLSISGTSSHLLTLLHHLPHHLCHLHGTQVQKY